MLYLFFKVKLPNYLNNVVYAKTLPGMKLFLENSLYLNHFAKQISLITSPYVTATIAKGCFSTSFHFNCFYFVSVPLFISH